jgi:hypothetical protein
MTYLVLFLFNISIIVRLFQTSKTRTENILTIPIKDKNIRKILNDGDGASSSVTISVGRLVVLAVVLGELVIFK